MYYYICSYHISYIYYKHLWYIHNEYNVYYLTIIELYIYQELTYLNLIRY